MTPLKDIHLIPRTCDYYLKWQKKKKKKKESPVGLKILRWRD